MAANRSSVRAYAVAVGDKLPEAKFRYVAQHHHQQQQHAGMVVGMVGWGVGREQASDQHHREMGSACLGRKWEANCQRLSSGR